MRNSRKFISVLMASVMTLSMAACGNSDTGSADSDSASILLHLEQNLLRKAGKVYNIGILQQLEHSFRLCYRGFQDALTELLGEGNVKFDLQNAQGEQANCSSIAAPSYLMITI